MVAEGEGQDTAIKEKRLKERNEDRQHKRAFINTCTHSGYHRNGASLTALQLLSVFAEGALMNRISICSRTVHFFPFQFRCLCP